MTVYGDPPSAPPPDSQGAKYAKPRPEAEAPAPAAQEPDPRMDCPWLDHIFDDEPVMSLSENREEYLAYNYFVQHARKFSPELMAKHTRKELTFRRLFDKERDKYRGEIVHVEGRLKRLTWIDSNKELSANGVKDLYEAWIFDEAWGSHPTVVVISELPPGIKPAEDIPSVRVAVDGYFFKRYKYVAPKDVRLAPLVIARTLTVQNPPATSTSPGAQAFNRLFLPVVLTMVLGMVTSVFLLHRWFRRGDDETRSRLMIARSDEFVAPIETPQAQRPVPEQTSWN